MVPRWAIPKVNPKIRIRLSRSWNFFWPTLTCIYKQNAHERCDFQFTFYHVPRCGVWLFWDKNDPTSVFLSPTQSQMKFFEKATNALKKLFRVFHLKLCVCLCDKLFHSHGIYWRERSSENNKMKNNIVIGVKWIIAMINVYICIAIVSNSIPN